jgi:hypothetical protein
MRRYNNKFDPRFVGLRIDKTDFIRKGINGDWVNSLPVESATEIDRCVKASLKALRRARRVSDLKFLSSNESLCKGTVYAALRFDHGERVLKAVAVGATPCGVFLVGRDRHVLTIGDYVKMKLRVDESTLIEIDEARVAKWGRLNGITGVTIRFSAVSVNCERMLEKVCSGLGEDQVEYVRDLDVETGTNGGRQSNQDGSVQVAG